MKKVSLLCAIIALLVALLGGCGKEDMSAASQTISRAPANAVKITFAEAAEPENYHTETVLTGEAIAWLDTQTGLAYTESDAITLDDTYGVAQKEPLSLPTDSDGLRGYCTSGDDTCLLTQDQAQIYRGDSLIFEEDGTWLAAAPGDDGFYLLRLDGTDEEAAGSWVLCHFNGTTITELAQIPDMGEFGTICRDETGSLYLGTDQGIVLYDLATNSGSYLLHWDDCGIYPYDVTAIEKTADGFLAAVAGDLCLLTTGKKEADTEPEVLRLGTLTSGSSTVSQLVANYNRNQSAYRLETVEYADVASLNMALLSGELDLLHIYNVPQSAYIAKGVLADLNPWIEKDASIQESDFFPAVWNATDTAGKRYSIISSFTLSGLMAPESLAGDRSGWTFSEFQSAISGTNVLEKSTKRMMLVITFDAGRYIDQATNTAFFNSEEFITYLEYINQFLLSESEVVADGQASQVTNMDIISVYDTQQETYAAMFWNGSPVRFLGFPSEDASGMSIDTVSGLELGMVSSGNQAGAWDVIAYALSEAFASNASNIGLPARVDVLQDQITEAVGDSQQSGQSYPESCGETLLDLISDAAGKRVWDSVVDGIVEEETEAFFAGDKTAEEVAEIIQNRVSIYLAEQS